MQLLVRYKNYYQINKIPEKFNSLFFSNGGIGLEAGFPVRGRQDPKNKINKK